MSVLISLNTHPDREPAIPLPEGAFVNRTPGYAEAVKSAIRAAVSGKVDLVLADSDGYHPAREIESLARLRLPEGPCIVKPYRVGIGFQSWAYSCLYSLVKGVRVHDATGGLCRLSLPLMEALPPLRARDMTVNVEILGEALRRGSALLQYPYCPGYNPKADSRRTSGYQAKLLKAMVR